MKNKYGLSKKITNNRFISLILLLWIGFHSPLNAQTISLIQAFADLEQRHACTFLYDVDLVKNVNVSPSKAKHLVQNLEQLLAPTPLDFKISGQNVFITQLEKVGFCGTLLDALSGSPLAFANVLIQGTNIGTSTDEQGKFNLEYYHKKHAKLELSYIGYQSKQLDLLPFKSPECRQISLIYEESVFEAVVVKAFTLDMLKLDTLSNAIRFSPQDIPTLPGWGEPDALRALQFLPGVSTADESAANLNIQGGSPDQNLILWDNIPIYHSGHFFGFYSFINPYIVQDLALHQAGFGSEYGGRVSGVIDIKGKPKTIDKAHFGIGLNLVNAHAFAEIPLFNNKVQLLLAGRRSFTDKVQSHPYRNLFDRIFQRGLINNNNELAEEEDDEEAVFSVPRFFYQDANAKLAWQISEKDHLQISSYIGQDNFIYNFNAFNIDSTIDNLWTSNRGISTTYQRKWDERWETEAIILYSNFQNDFNSHSYSSEIEENVAIESDNNLNDFSVQLQQHFYKNTKQRFQFGLQWQQQYISYFNFFEYYGEFENETNQAHGITSTAYVNYHWQWLPEWRTALGLRMEHYTGNDINAPSLQPRLSLQFHPADSPWRFRAAFGKYRQYVYQLPAPYESFNLGLEFPIWTIADDFFPILKGTHYTINTQYEKANTILEVSPYFKRITNLSSWRLGHIETGNPFTSGGISLAYGVDMLLKKRWKRQNVWLSYSLSKAEQQFLELNDEDFFPTNYDQRHRLNCTYTLALDHWDMSASWVFQSGRPYTVPSSDEPYFDEEDQAWYLEFEYANNARLPNYHRLDVAANYKFQYKALNGKIGLSIFNLYSRHNLLDIDFDVADYEEEQTLEIPKIINLERDMLFLTPNLFFELEW